MKRPLVTGKHAFVGSTLARMLAIEPALADRSAALLAPDFDILDKGASDRIVRDSKPDAVLHLAAQSSVALASRDPAATLRINLLGTLNLLRALKQSNLSGPLVFVSSGDVYGIVPEAINWIRHMAGKRTPGSWSRLKFPRAAGPSCPRIRLNRKGTGASGVRLVDAAR